jgi:hypothetical protein
VCGALEDFHMRIMIRLALAATVLSAGACKKVEASNAAATTAASAKGATGFADPSNDPAVVAAAKPIIDTCGWDAKKGFDGCDKLQAWWDKRFEKVDATLMNFIEDPDPKVRWLGLGGLGSWGWSYRSDKTLGTRLLAALQKEPADSIFDAQMTYLMINVSDTDLLKSLHDYAMKPTTAFDVKAMLSSWWSNDMAYDIIKSLSTGDKNSQKEAAQGFATSYDKHRDEACKYWMDRFEDDAKEVRSVAVGHLTGGWSGNTTHDTQGDWYVSGGGGGPSSLGEKACDDKQVEQALAKIEVRVKANTVDDSNYVYGLKNLVKHGKTPAIKKQAEAELVQIIATKGAQERSFALSQLVDADDKQIALAKKYEKDDELKSTATYLVEQHAKAAKK